MMVFAAGCNKPDEPNNSGSANGHGYVDLGLPSGTLWATCNVGASAPESYGDYFAWGETQPKEVYDYDTYKYYDGYDLIKYTGNDGLSVLQQDDDVATVIWGAGWSVPTKTQWEELLQYTTNAWTTQNGVNGRLFTALNGSGHCLFLPAPGRIWNELDYVNGYGYYWSSLLYNNAPVCAWGFVFGVESYNVSYIDRGLGYSVRPVYSTR